ncbi:YdeI/OmpD-associated family protein [Neotabrizicola shimadae]|uniref:YdeI/OmpD-associated family protein n=1 Tax=Neotabrizicola shimadae TaxID=2807096 RepID=A0A8G0ZMU2_9RHOB|nr:YdeI/OmpD-associated family protein [Neotabrizicola shimadae]QYZ68236.1 YdeI/OmpD-associated family protein [Neotabrizicola shimadae]
MANALDTAPIVTVRSRSELRAWLADHHGEKGPAWLACHRPHHPDFLGAEPATEELLCWGWINSIPRALDADRSMILISPRKPGSAWSAVNKRLVDQARASGAMTPAGEAKIAAAQADGSWSFLDDVERLEVPPDLAAALGPLHPVWDSWPRSVKRAALEWIKTAKTDKTRTARIADVTASAAQGQRPSPFRR